MPSSMPSSNLSSSPIGVFDSGIGGLSVLRALRAEGDLVVGDNQPYSVSDDSDYGANVHAEARGLPYVELEIRQDLIADAAGQQAWAQRLARLLPGLLTD